MNKNFFQDISRYTTVSASLLAAVYLGLSPRFAGGLYANVLFQPHCYPEGYWEIQQVQGIQPEDVIFYTADNIRLHGWFFQVPGAAKTFLFNHGNSGNLTNRLTSIELLLKTGASVFIYDYRGYGRSAGVPSVAGICEDGLAAYDYLIQNRKLSPQSIILYGESLGAAVACQTIGSKRHCAGIILQSGFSSLRQIGIEVLPFVRIYPSLLFPKPDLDNIAIVKKEHPPLLIMHGARDIVIPFTHGEKLFTSASHPKTFVCFPEAAHNDITSVAAERYAEAVRTFIARLR